MPGVQAVSGHETHAHLGRPLVRTAATDGARGNRGGRSITCWGIPLHRAQNVVADGDSCRQVLLIGDVDLVSIWLRDQVKQPVGDVDLALVGATWLRVVLERVSCTAELLHDPVAQEDSP